MNLTAIAKASVPDLSGLFENKSNLPVQIKSSPEAELLKILKERAQADELKILPYVDAIIAQGINHRLQLSRDNESHTHLGWATKLKNPDIATRLVNDMVKSDMPYIQKADVLRGARALLADKTPINVERFNKYDKAIRAAGEETYHVAHPFPAHQFS